MALRMNELKKKRDDYRDWLLKATPKEYAMEGTELMDGARSGEAGSAQMPDYPDLSLDMLHDMRLLYGPKLMDALKMRFSGEPYEKEALRALESLPGYLYEDRDYDKFLNDDWSVKPGWSYDEESSSLKAPAAGDDEITDEEVAKDMIESLLQDLKDLGYTDDEIQEYRDRYEGTDDSWVEKLLSDSLGIHGEEEEEGADMTGDGKPDTGVQIEVDPKDVTGDGTADGIEVKVEGKDDVCPDCGKSPCECEKTAGTKKSADTKKPWGEKQAEGLREALGRDEKERERDEPREEKKTNIGKFAKNIRPHQW